MANPEHLAILKQGIKAWNEWRTQTPDVKPDLSGVALCSEDCGNSQVHDPDPAVALGSTGFYSPDFSGADFRNANLCKASLMGSCLVEVDFSHAALGGANLRRANLHKANLSYANLYAAQLDAAYMTYARLIATGLSAANLSLAALDHANLRGANFFTANLNAASLSGAMLDDAYFGETSIANIDLSEAMGLEAVQHMHPSTIGIDTIYKSKGKIPEAFLRGCGVPEELIAYIPSLIGAMKPIEFYSAFISYSSKDEEFAKRLHSRLRDDRVRVWFAPEDLKIGDKFRVAIDEAIRAYDKLMVVLSAASVQSDWVEKEVEAAMEKERKEKRTVLFPLRLDDAVMDVSAGWAADIRRTRYIGDFTRWKDHDAFEKAYKRLLRDLSTEKTVKV